MTTLLTNPPSLSEQEQEVIRLASEFAALERNPAWLRIKTYMQHKVSEKATKRDQCLSSNERVLARLQLSYLLAKENLDDILGYIEDVKRSRVDILRDIAQDMGYTPKQATEAFIED